jgi:hypothetical protein
VETLASRSERSGDGGIRITLPMERIAAENFPARAGAVADA